MPIWARSGRAERTGSADCARYARRARIRQATARTRPRATAARRSQARLQRTCNHLGSKVLVGFTHSGDAAMRLDFRRSAGPRSAGSQPVRCPGCHELVAPPRHTRPSTFGRAIRRRRPPPAPAGGRRPARAARPVPRHRRGPPHRPDHAGHDIDRRRSDLHGSQRMDARGAPDPDRGRRDRRDHRGARDGRQHWRPAARQDAGPARSSRSTFRSAPRTPLPPSGRSATAAS